MKPHEIEKLAEQWAPLVWLHSEEKYHPMSPDRFIEGCRLREYDRRQPDHAPLHRVWNIVARKWEKPKAVKALMGKDYFGPKPLFLSGEFGQHEDGKYRRPFDDKSANQKNVFLEHRDRKCAGNPSPTGKVASYYFWKIDDKGRGILTYWWFYGYSQFQQGGNLIGHQGDWEHMSLVFKDEDLTGAYFAAHGAPKEVDAAQLQMSGGRPVAYSARGSHASYHEAGSYGYGDETGKGTKWETWLKLRPLNAQPWRQFAGAWGGAGNLADTTGPLGPWYKRKKY